MNWPITRSVYVSCASNFPKSDTFNDGKHITRTMSDQAGYRSGNALDLYSVKFLVRISGYTHSGFLVVSLSSSKNTLEYYLEQATIASFQILRNSSFSIHPIQFDTESVVKKPMLGKVTS
jgi:hypothetical protein